MVGSHGPWLAPSGATALHIIGAYPKVMKYFTKSAKNTKKAMEKAYGFPYTAPLKPMEQSMANLCWKKCTRYVREGRKKNLVKILVFCQTTAFIKKYAFVHH